MPCKELGKLAVGGAFLLKRSVLVAGPRGWEKESPPWKATSSRRNIKTGGKNSVVASGARSSARKGLDLEVLVVAQTARAPKTFENRSLFRSHVEIKNAKIKERVHSVSVFFITPPVSLI